MNREATHDPHSGAWVDYGNVTLTEAAKRYAAEQCDPASLPQIVFVRDRDHPDAIFDVRVEREVSYKAIPLRTISIDD